MRFVRFGALTFAALVICSSTALAHPGLGTQASGVLSGLAHPLLGLDHFLAMVTVGLLAACLGGRATWLLPATFLGCMLLGGLVGLVGWQLPAMEYGIALTVILLGFSLARGNGNSRTAAMAFCAVSGLLHGHVHGTEMPLVAQPSLYLLGFLGTSAALHLAGVLGAQRALNTARGGMALRYAGAAIGVAGIALAVGV